MSVDWEYLEMTYPVLCDRLDEMSERIEKINSAIDRCAQTMTNPLTRPRWEARRDRYADIALAIYEELIVLDGGDDWKFTYADMALLREARDAFDDAADREEQS